MFFLKPFWLVGENGHKMNKKQRWLLAFYIHREDIPKEKQEAEADMNPRTRKLFAQISAVSSMVTLINSFCMFVGVHHQWLPVGAVLDILHPPLLLLTQ